MLGFIAVGLMVRFGYMHIRLTIPVYFSRILERLPTPWLPYMGTPAKLHS